MKYNCVVKQVKDPWFDKITRVIPSLDIDRGPWIAGGSTRLLWHGHDYRDHDIDVFYPSLSLWEQHLQLLQNNRHVIKKHTTDNAVTFDITIEESEIKIQIIKKDWHDNIESIFDSFDFTCCQYVTDGRTIISTRQALEDCCTKTLRWNTNTRRELDTRRIVKYSLYGFTANNDILSKVAKLCKENALSDNWGSSDY